jgi:tonB family C-terminal domain
MKKALFLGLGLCLLALPGLSPDAQSQQPSSHLQQEDQKIYEVVDTEPGFPGGMSAMMKYLAENIRYPEAAVKAGKQGRVMVSFVVEADGSISHAKVARGISAELNKEALRVVRAMPKWEPGRHQGKVVRTRYVLPVVYRLK